MAKKTVAQVKTSLIGLWGYEEWDEVTPQDQQEIGSFISSALFDCYAPVDGTRPNFGEQYWSEILPAPVATTLGLTQGSKVVTGYTFEDKYAGSFVKIGDRLYRYAGKSGSTYYLVQPWQDTTGSYAATVYHNAVALPGLLLETASAVPELLGVGILSPLPDPDQELIFRSEPSVDFRSIPTARQPFTNTRRRFDSAVLLDVGDPEFYYIDSARTHPTDLSPVNRLHIYPLTNLAHTVCMRAQFLPAGDLPDDGSTLPMPFDAVDNILLPIAREKLAMNSAGRRFTGNVPLIMQAAENARKQLRSLTHPQRYVGGGFRTANGW